MPTVAVVRPRVVIEVSCHDVVMVTVPINFGGMVIVMAVVAADWGSIAIAVVSAVAIWNPGSVVAWVVTWVVTAWSTGVVRGIACAHLYTQAS